jgi:histidinol-phosphatase (PHP family)
MLKDHPQPGIRGDYSTLENYINSINELKKKYQDRIKIHIGLEAEALPYYFPYYQELLSSHKIEYLCLGNHLEIDENNQLKFFFSSATTRNDVRRYTNSLIKGMKTGLFKFVCHPDYFMGSYVKWDSFTRRMSRKIIRTAKRRKIPLEFNFGSLRNGKKILGEEYRFPYPYDQFWKMVKRYKCKVIIGLDAHSPLDISNKNNDAGYQMAKDLDLDILSKLDF